ncbi:MAG: MFS transporter [Oceanipulchritudo sp.]
MQVFCQYEAVLELSVIERKKIPFMTSVKYTLSNGPFLVITAMIVFGQLAANIFSQMGIYANIYVLSNGDTKAGASLTGYVAIVFFFVMMASIHLGSALSQRYSKHAVVLGAAVLTVCGGLLKFVLYNPDYPYLILLAPLFSAPGGAVGSYMITSMMADVATYDEWKNGTRREGMFTAVGGWLYKVSISLAGILGGFVLVLIGFDEQLGGAQSEFTKNWLVIGMVIGSTVPGLITIIAMAFYPLTRDKMDRYVSEIRDRETGQAEGP